MPSTIEQVHNEFKYPGLTILVVNIQESQDLVPKWVKDNRVTSLVLLDLDGAVTLAYRVTGTPTVVLIGRDGKLVGRPSGRGGGPPRPGAPFSPL